MNVLVVRNDATVLQHSLNNLLLRNTAPISSVSADPHNFDMSTILGSKLITLRRTRLSSSCEPSIIIRRCDVLIVAIKDVVQVECCLVGDAIGMTAIGFACEREAEKGKSIYFRFFWFEYRWLRCSIDDTVETDEICTLQ